ncbi:c-type cytochrome [Aeromonas dhakensis]|uniref:c-type cytochrome n=1 Tax=Aeromonas dhakensis TaxID=196024 RepID=UPI001119753E|nr:c-type cytochrome [Aeromonas dhakensis]TND54878.1 cytochrome C [Aeromonas dhakensis]WAF72488.1 c-type cytochrome [Aeromonas dhakensis]
MQRWLGALLLLLWGPVQAADVEAGKAKAAVCAACHGAEGRALVPNYPHLAGQNAAYLVKQLKAFKDGSRKEPLMVPFMAPLSEADMENLAAYYASLK